MAGKLILLSLGQIQIYSHCLPDFDKLGFTLYAAFTNSIIAEIAVLNLVS
jgi:hypothetical protein